MNKYLVIGGDIISAYDDERHYIHPKRVSELYGLNSRDCDFVLNDDDLICINVSKYKKVFRPDPTGRYISQ